ncbi:MULTISPECIES: LPS export ABC transporter permease LptG [Corallincola]|uniref:Lipopolysaccharide ABC transporter permease LptG n=3 Tax=Corallincola TaxID=1775176 RepID=A0A368NN05_9GAMM|nr:MULTISPECIES: LPS export ABC transporter permease LptG [Corallincola]RCU51957.1 lipopolysaccharide ABC transporter permease LptG [Corallincola holothuriorum]TAA47647.1 lipopolysaccharide ABC transporter permease LptG [Corallincola spongiicola]TCI05630.1 lipopolysaccharide ABC transporter permease LptG [Corallincola luteus]
MKILDLYIGRTIVTTSSLCLVVLVGLSGILKFVGQLRRVGKGTYEMSDALLFTVLSVPRDIEMFFPMAVLLGALIGLGMLASNSELIVMQAGGWSRLQITGSVMKTAIPLMLLVMALGEYGAPVAERMAKELRAQELSGGSLITSQRGIWAKDGDSFINIGEVVDENTLGQVTIYEFDRKLDLHRIVAARAAEFKGSVWQLEDVTFTQFEEDKVTNRHQPTDFWTSYLTPEKLSVVTVKPEALSLAGLSDYIAYLENSNQESARYELAFWRKLLQPATVAVMMLLALSFVFGPLRSVTMGARILMGIVAGFTFYICEQVFGPITLVYQIPPVIGAILPATLFTGIAVFLLRRKH